MKLLFKFILSLFLACALLLLMQQLVQIGLDNNRNFKTSFIKNHKLTAQFVVQGPCESETTIDPAVLSSYLNMPVYNLASNHTDFAENYLTLKLYLKYQKKPKAVLLFVGADSFDSTKVGIFNSYRFSHFFNDKDVRNVMREMDPTYTQTVIIPFMRFSYYSNFVYYKSLSGWIDYIKGNKTPQSKDGYTEPTMSWNQPLSLYDSTNKTYYNLKWSMSREKYFIKLINLLKEENIKLLVYTSPTYEKELSYQLNRQALLNKITSVCQSYNVPYFRLDTLSMKSKSDFFFNSDNLTMAGVKVFNPIIGQLLKDTLPSLIDSSKIEEANQYKTYR